MKRLLAPNGNTSNLNDEQYKLVRTTSFKKWFGDWEVLAEAKTLSNDIKGVYKFVALDNIERFLFEISQQANSSNSELNGAIKTVGKRIVELALKLFPNSKVGDEYIPVVSKVIDDNNEPLVVYHGTPDSRFSVFDKNKFHTRSKSPNSKGFFFTPSKDYAEAYSESYNNIHREKAKEFLGYYPKAIEPRPYAKEIPCFLNIKNPKYSKDSLLHTIKSIKINDGLIVYYLNKNEIFEIAVFNPNQIKLADGSNTTFDANNDDIRYKNGGALNNKSTSVIVYHGSTRQFDEFDNSKLGEATKSKSAKFGFWFTDDIETAKSYPRAENWNKVQYFIDNNKMKLAEKLENDIDKNKDIKYLKKVRLTYKKPLIIDAEENVYNDFSNEIEDAIKIAIENKNDVLIVERLSDNADYSEYTPANHYLVLDNSIIEIISENKFNNGGNVNNAFLQIKSLIDKSEITDKFNYEYSIQYHSLYEELIKVSSELGEWDSPKLTKEVENIIKDKFYKELKTRINLVDGKIQLFRAILIKDINTIDIENLGVYWAYSYDFAQVFNDMGYEHNEKDISKYSEYIIKADFNLIDIDWSATLDYYIMSEFGEGEIRLKKDVPAYNLKIQKRGDDEWRNVNGKIFKAKKGGLTIAQTPAPKKERIYGSNTNKEKSSESNTSAKQIVFNENTMKSIKNKVDKHNEENPNKKITLSSAKAVVRRGMGAYSSSHRPTIKGGKPNSRVAWGLARLNAFIYKIKNGVSKSGKYTQDDDLIDELNIKYNIGGDVSDASFNNVKNDKTNYLDVLKDIWSNFNIKF